MISMALDKVQLFSISTARNAFVGEMECFTMGKGRYEYNGLFKNESKNILKCNIGDVTRRSLVSGDVSLRRNKL